VKQIEFVNSYNPHFALGLLLYLNHTIVFKKGSYFTYSLTMS